MRQMISIRHSPDSLPGMGIGNGGKAAGASVAPGAPMPSPTREDGAAEPKPQIRAFGQSLTGAKHGDSWKRQPNVNGTGAIHVRSFHCKLTGESLENLDRQINHWLDQHPEYEVKFVTTSVGDWTGKLKEPNLIVQLWV